MESVDELCAEDRAEIAPAEPACVQQGCYFIELTPDWIVLRASENIHHLLGKSHVTLIDEPLGKLVHAQALHDLRNLFSRLSGTTGIARAYRIRLTDELDLVDISFQLVGGRVLIEAVECADKRFGEAFGTVGGLIAGLTGTGRQQLLDNAARRMRALTGYDRVTVVVDGMRAESSRGGFAAGLAPGVELPSLVSDCEADAVGIFPRRRRGTSVDDALMRAPDANGREQLRLENVRSCMTVRFACDGLSGYFRCDSRIARKASFELHAAAELFAQLFAMRLQIDALRGG